MSEFQEKVRKNIEGLVIDPNDWKLVRIEDTYSRCCKCDISLSSTLYCTPCHKVKTTTEEGAVR